MQSPLAEILKTKNLQELNEQQWTLLTVGAKGSDIDLHQILAFAQSQEQRGQFRQAAVGRGNDAHRREEVRNDSIYWLDKKDETPSFVAQLQRELNRHLYLGIQTVECHFSHYLKGQFYQEHLDQPKTRSFLLGERLITFVLYLNLTWQPCDAGQLQIRNTLHGLPALQIIEPLWGSLILFRSDTILHQVLTSQRERWSLTGWFRRS